MSVVQKQTSACEQKINSTRDKYRNEQTPV